MPGKANATSPQKRHSRLPQLRATPVSSTSGQPYLGVREALPGIGDEEVFIV
jgi:hypothetical protein